MREEMRRTNRPNVDMRGDFEQGYRRGYEEGWKDHAEESGENFRGGQR